MTNPLNVSVIAGDDAQVTANLTKKSDGTVPSLAGSTITVDLYDPITKEVITTLSGDEVLIVGGTITFTFPAEVTATLIDGRYPWKAHILTLGGTQYTVTSGDDNLSIGHLHVQNLP